MSEERDFMALAKTKPDLAKLEAILVANNFEDYTLKHHFQNGIYVRTLTVPANLLFIGERHRFETCNFLASGDLSIYMENDKPVMRIQGPCLFNSEKYMKKLLFSHTEVVFSTIHKTELTEVAEIEKHFTIPEEEYKQEQLEEHQQEK